MISTISTTWKSKDRSVLRFAYTRQNQFSELPLKESISSLIAWQAMTVNVVWPSWNSMANMLCTVHLVYSVGMPRISLVSPKACPTYVQGTARWVNVSLLVSFAVVAKWQDQLSTSLSRKQIYPWFQSDSIDSTRIERYPSLSSWYHAQDISLVQGRKNKTRGRFRIHFWRGTWRKRRDIARHFAFVVFYRSTMQWANWWIERISVKSSSNPFSMPKWKKWRR